MENEIRQVSKQEQTELFQWLFGNQVKIKQEEDILLAPYYEDINIYYTEEIYNLFQTVAMRRTGKIMQLGSNIFRKSNSYHTRLEHAKGAYRNSIQFLTIQYRNPEWRKYIERNKLKGYLVEKIKFMCVHDIGHSMFSHSIEKMIGDENCTHEDIGQKILQEDKEVKKVLEQIKAKEQKSNLQGDGSLELLCEGNIDFDRKDYLLRDRLYTGAKNEDDLILKLDTMCELKWMEEENKYGYVYKEEALPYIEKFLSIRDEMYKKIYQSKQRVIDDELASQLVQEIKDRKISATEKMQRYLKNIVGKEIEEIDVHSILETNDILFLNQLIYTKKQLEKEEILNYIMPDSQTLLQIAISLLDPQNTNYNDYEEEEKEFIKNLRKLISKKTEQLEMEKVIPSVRLKEDKQEEIENKIQKILGEDKKIKGIYYHTTKFKKYNKKEPIYVETAEGKIVTLDKHPNLQMDLSNEYYYDFYVILPELKEQGVEPEKLEEIRKLIEEYQKEEVELTNSSLEANRMSMFQTQQGESNDEKKLDKFFRR